MLVRRAPNSLIRSVTYWAEALVYHHHALLSTP